VIKTASTNNREDSVSVTRTKKKTLLELMFRVSIAGLEVPPSTSFNKKQRSRAMLRVC